jgi:mono/diheme cytochrome c family protein
MQRKPIRFTLLVLGATMACGGGANSSPPTATPSAPPAEGVATATGGPDLATQIARGASVYAEYCADCHGDSGEGVRKSPAVIGPGALPLDPPSGAKRSVPLRTGADLIAYLRATMPADDPGSMSDSDYAAVSAFLIDANGVDLRGVALDSASAPALVLHP